MAPVSDLPRMLYTESRDTGHDSPVVEYWNKVIGDRRAERDKLINISPAESAETFQAPVLLIHGTDDDVVPIEQSYIMKRALEELGKPVELLVMEEEDHWLSNGPTRLQAARAMETFLEEQIGPSTR